MQFKKVSSSRPNRFVTIFRLEKHFWAHPLLLKHVFTFTNFFWNLLVLDTTKLYAFVSSPLTFFIYLCYLHPWPCSIWVKNHHAFCYLNICATFCTISTVFSIFHMQLFKSTLHHQMNKLPHSEVWELMVDGKKSIVSRELQRLSIYHWSCCPCSAHQ